MKFDDVLIHIGEFGKFQRIQYFLACVTAVFCGAQVLSTVYVVFVPEFRCKLPSSVWPNDRWITNNNSQHEALISKYIPLDDKGKYKTCVINNVSSLYSNTTMKCDSWVFDPSQMDESFISKYGVVCDSSSWKLFITQSYLFGVLIGSPVFGLVSDMIGRKKCLMIGIAMTTVFGVACAFATSSIMLAIFKFFTGAAVACLFPCAFVLGMELVGPNRRLDAGIIIEYAFALGIVLDALFGFLIRHWTWIQFTISIPVIFCLSLWWLMPESPRWLLGHNREAEAKVILDKAAATNGVTLPENYLEKEEDSPKGSIIDVVKSPVLLIRSLIIFSQWAIAALVYYGISLSTSNLPGSMYLNAFLSGAVEFPGYLIVHLLLNRLGRKRLHFFSMFISGLFCTSGILLVYFAEDVQWAFILVSMLGKCFNTSAFGIIYIWTSELYPTVVRSAGVGVASMFARIGTLLAPFIGDLSITVPGKIGRALPLLIFGITSIVAAILCLFLPETYGKPLPETIEEGERFGREEKAKPKNQVAPLDDISGKGGANNDTSKDNSDPEKGAGEPKDPEKGAGEPNDPEKKADDAKNPKDGLANPSYQPEEQTLSV